MFVYGHQLGWWRQFFVETLCIFPYDGLYDTLAKMSGFTFKFPPWFEGISKTICILIECANTKWAQKCAKLCSSRSPSIHFMSFREKNGLGKNEIVLVIIWIIMFTYTKRDDRTWAINHCHGMIENYVIWETHTKEAEKLKKKLSITAGFN